MYVGRKKVPFTKTSSIMNQERPWTFNRGLSKSRRDEM